MMTTTYATVPADVMLPADLDLDRQHAFHDLLRALAGTLDVRSVFRQVSRIATRIIPHDEAALALLTEDGKFRLFASTQDDGAPRLLCSGEHDAACDPATSTRFGHCKVLGFQSGLRVPVRIDGSPVGVLALLSREVDAFTEQDLTLAEFLGDFVAVALSHQRLSEARRVAAVERERAAHVDASVELLRAVGSVLDIRAVFPQVSEIANKVLAHDALTMAFHDGNGEVAIQAATPGDFPELGGILRHAASPTPSANGFHVVSDLAEERMSFVDPSDFQERLIAAGYRSMLGMKTAAHSQLISVAFWSKRPHAFSEEDVAIARRITDYVALAVSHEQLVAAAQQVAEAKARAERLEVRVHKLAAELDARSGLGHMVGKSALWMDVLKRATQVAATETTVLLGGDSGTGKEVVARFVHRASPRKAGPFIAINCAALPEQLLESELFGYERGAFTGAQQAKPGQIELAAGGVLFLDEVSEMSLSAQAKFLRVLQEREFQRLGGTRLLKADVRVVAATNRDLKKAVDRGAFREDLYYRLHIFDIRLPPLRERPSDIPLLADVFLQDIGRSFGRPPAGLTRDAKDALLHYGWPGNVRELRNALERAVILAEGGLITAGHLSLRSDEPVSASTSTDLAVVERETIARVMQETGGNKSRAADRLGLTRTQLYVRLRKYKLDQPPLATH
jgi:transcriptional regulator with GAF, ATPase, and Fis domain